MSAMFNSVDVMLSKNGIYFIITHPGFTFVEVEDGRVYSLKLNNHERDNELRDGGWNMSKIMTIFGPFYRDDKDARRYKAIRDRIYRTMISFQAPDNMTLDLSLHSIPAGGPFGEELDRFADDCMSRDKKGPFG